MVLGAVDTWDLSSHRPRHTDSMSNAAEDEPGLRLVRSVFPVFAGHTIDGVLALDKFMGTVFALADGTLVSVSHVLAEPELGALCIVQKSTNGRYVPHAISRAVRHPMGYDLAVARAPSLLTDSPLRVAADEAQRGTDVFTYGFPLTHSSAEGSVVGRRHELQSRYLQGYVTRAFSFQPSGSRIVTPTVEVDMPVPPGISGAPLIAVGTTQVVGVLFGQHGTEQGPNDRYTWGLAHRVVSLKHLLEHAAV